MKLWTIKTNECVKTLDAHQEKVWGLHASRKDDKMVTGSADSNITVWVVRVVGLTGFTVERRKVTHVERMRKTSSEVEK